MISVCIATYNGEAFIEQQLRSILAQIAADDEIIISDDGSEDNTLSIINQLNDKRIRLFRHNKTTPKDNFANALSKSKGDIIFLSDQDDVWLPNKVRRCKEELLHCDLLVHDGNVTDEHLHIIHPSLFGLVNAHEGLLHNLAFCGFYGSAMAFNRCILESALPLPHGRYIAHDWWIGLVAEIIGTVRFLNEPLYLYRRHASTITETYSRSLLTRSSRSLNDKLLSRLYMLLYITRYKLIYNKKRNG